MNRIYWRRGMAMGVEYFEDYAVGAEYLTHARTIAETDIVTFVNSVGFFEPLFIDMEFV
jgi:acyl dehydratase